MAENPILMSIVPGSNGKLVITDGEMKALEKFRPLVINTVTQEYMKYDGYLLRWLRASKLNVNDAVEKLKISLKWRKDNKIDTILNERFPEFDLMEENGGIDREGRLVSTLSLGKFDIRKLVLGGKRDRFLRFSIFESEKGEVLISEMIRRSNGTLTDPRLVFLLDLQGFSLRNHACLACIPVLTTHFRQAEDNYPGASAHNVYINTPRIALRFIETYSSFHSDETRNTVKVFGTDREEWTKYLHTIIAPDQLTYQFGGTKKN